MTNYTITIAGVGGSAPDDGFIDPKTVYRYANIAETAGSSADSPTTLAASVAKARANHRNRMVVATLQNGGCREITSVTTTGTPSSNAAPASIIYAITLSGDISAIKTLDETNSNAVLTGNAAVKRLAARAMCSSYTPLMEVFDPTTSSAPGNSTAYNRTGSRMIYETVGALYSTLSGAEASITIAAV